MSDKKKKFSPVNFTRLYNKTYQEVAQVGRAQLSPEQVFQMVVEYFTWAENNAVEGLESAAFQGVVEQTNVVKPRVFTTGGLVLFLGIARRTWDNWRKREGYRDVVEFAENVIYEQRFQLGANQLISPQFAARSIGLEAEAITVNVNTGDNVIDTSGESMREAVKSVLGEL